MWEGTGVLISKNSRSSFYIHVHKHQAYIHTGKDDIWEHTRQAALGRWLDQWNGVFVELTKKNNFCAPERKI